MQQFFAQKAMSVHNGKVVVIKVMRMLLKPGNKNPLVISVCETCAKSAAFADYLFTEIFRDHFQYTVTQKTVPMFDKVELLTG
jgi:hypothetical protein